MNPASPSPAPNLFFDRTPDPANSHDTDPPTDMAAWEQRMAKLVGLNAEEELPLSLVNTSPDEEEHRALHGRARGAAPPGHRRGPMPRPGAEHRPAACGDRRRP